MGAGLEDVRPTAQRSARRGAAVALVGVALIAWQFWAGTTSTSLIVVAFGLVLLGVLLAQRWIDGEGDPCQRGCSCRGKR